MSDVNIRKIAAQSLMDMEKEGLFLSTIESAVLDKYNYLDNKDKAFYKRLMDGTTEERIRIDYILGLFSSTKVSKLKPYIRAVLRMSIYQIIWLDAVPDSAACDEAVKLVKKSGQSALAGFVNGVLRNIIRNKSDIKYPDQKKNPIQYASIYYSCPEWIVKRIAEEYGLDVMEEVLKASVTETAVSVRLRVEGKALDKLCEKWNRCGVEVEDNPLLDFGRFLKGTGAIANLPGFNDGSFIVQDTGSMLVADMAGIKAGDLVMDVCAAPGGKSMHAADILCKLESEYKADNKAFAPGIVYSYDISEEKCERIRENINRLKLNNVKVKAADATVYNPEMENKADVVIVDAPCSGIGVIGHKSDIKYRLLEEDIDELARIQKKIIDVAVKYVKPGGRLVFSTCTISRCENDEQVKYIMEQYPFTLVKDTNERPNPYQLLPGRDRSDGFFIAVFERQ